MQLNPKVEAMAKAEQKKEDEQRLEALSTRDRLMRDLTRHTVKVMLSEDSNDFVEIRLLSPAEQRWLADLSTQFKTIIDRLGRLGKKPVDSDERKAKRDREIGRINEEANRLIDEQLHFLAKICVDPELDHDFWKAGEGFANDVPTLILAEALGQSSRVSGERTSQARKFRSD